MDNMELLNKYVQAKEEEKKVKSSVKQYGDTLKQVMVEEDLSAIADTESKIGVTLNKSERIKFDEQKVIEAVRKVARRSKDVAIKENLKSCIKTVTIIDESKLESLMYDGLISADDLQGCYTSTTIETLRIKKLK